LLQLCRAQARFAFHAPLKRLVFQRLPRFNVAEVSEVTRILQSIESGEAKTAEELMPAGKHSLAAVAWAKTAIPGRECLHFL